MAEVICECGHKNPHGTILCEVCGKPLDEERTKEREFLTMRYEGSARRSQTYTRTPIDKVWNFFSSVKVGVTLIVLTFIASAIGTIFPQQMLANIPLTVTPAQFYQNRYGVLGQLYYQLGFTNLYGSWWFLILISLLGLSVIVASIDRGIPLRRALKKQGITRHDTFMKRQRLFTATEVNHQGETMSQAENALKKRHYKIRKENGNIFAEKGRFSRWGAYVNHTGLIIIMIGAVLRFIPGMYVDKSFWVREGQTKAIPGTHQQYYLQNHKFILQLYNKNNPRFGEAVRKEAAGGLLPKNFQTNVTLYKKVAPSVVGAKPQLQKVKNDKIQVNHPLRFNGFSVYQVDFQMNQFSKMSFTLNKKSTGNSFGEFTVDLYNPKKIYKLGNGYKIKLMAYFPDFYFNKKNEPDTKSPIPNNPAFIFKMMTPDKPKGEVSFIGIRKNLEPFAKGKNEYKIKFAGIQTKNFSALNVHKDRTLWVIIIGTILFLAGVTQGLYWQYRRIWLKRKGNEIWLAASTNKNWFGLKKDMEAVTDRSGLAVPVDRLDQKKQQKKEGLRNDGSIKH